ncbi:bifunctional tRNA (5-methylaminomethyl-2-thiouridine)(34)-methyltransferase MnmD/FAD-dependent 5-carboxymethylaminomethyl-2-thiouridine(34) oxidoreductase MnmC [Robbsia sp. Bb-Pol-6]|uniref:tRNA 5-methylaminomethyl-2-thiouridine biosynthesis bifunctional protein MnmC n=1 Tax=Robbsia betulipollinis TaxID=2981849 RepID=A0ABT3ZTI8_9BURK|nr:bifunctional tRNA (5-methylaminomethyl-2-thiouridine)(34)-methyltransferase MnmD/FAD-dependent 5-carboxymethylaminomethyl-2-thiouridine(34) oxidoreductase MnmC [Robbsia betulipollinis]MCY0389178.1 bifunctional tRNA (5-methylaminomethyl-2-thiouridine)(34)-methyltransferase MnmD/FAD-dependent 5-carboxymethylaminomethyl-2-thiouridine(34) oxidoreductase MnmC [Robbsia betulipollinis]
MIEPLSPPDWVFREDGTPFSPRYDDIYHSASGALGQARHVFLDGNGLPGRWSGRPLFTIVEAGFGQGLNFLATWLAWRSDPHAPARLHFVSLEKHRFPVEDLRALLARHVAYETESSIHRPAHAAGTPGMLEQMVTALCRAWPPPTTGLHRLEFDAGRVVLTLGLGDAPALAAKLRLRADAFFLDGFSPSKNPRMWDPTFFGALARLADEQATLSTYTSAGEVRRNLIAAGFAMRRAPAYGSKREMLVGHFAPRWRVRRHPPPRRAEAARREAIVIGAGMAGCALAERLAARGWHVNLIDQGAGPATAASGNPAGVFHPMITRDEGLAARLSRAGFLYALSYWRALEAAGHPLRWSAQGLFQKSAESDDDARGDTKRGGNGSQDAHPLNDGSAIDQTAPGLPSSIARPVPAGDASALTGVAGDDAGWLFAQGGWIDPVSLCHAQLAAAGARLHTYFSQRVERLEAAQEPAGGWHAIDATGRRIASGAVVILANAHDASRLARLQHAPTESVRGQLTLLPGSLFPTLTIPLIGGAYLTPTADGALTGASYGIGDTRTALDPDEHLENLQRLAALLRTSPVPSGSPASRIAEASAYSPTTPEPPGSATDASASTPFGLDPARMAGRVAFRCVTGDRLPMIGPLGDEETAQARAHALTGAQPLDLPRASGLYGAFGYGSRGLLWSAIGAELIASQIEGEPPPLESDLIDAIDPARFLMRNLRRGKLF